MLITRRGIFLGASASGFALMLTGRQAPALMFEGVPLGKAPGDEGYKHGLYHDAYQKLFGDLGHCGCGHGECRVTEWRKTQLDSPLGFDVIAYREWVPLQNSLAGCRIPNKCPRACATSGRIFAHTNRIPTACRPPYGEYHD